MFRKARVLVERRRWERDLAAGQVARQVREWVQCVCGFVSMQLPAPNCQARPNKHSCPLPAGGAWEKAGARDRGGKGKERERGQTRAGM